MSPPRPHELAYAAALLDAAATRPPKDRALEQDTRSVARVGAELRRLAGVQLETAPIEDPPDRADWFCAAHLLDVCAHISPGFAPLLGRVAGYLRARASGAEQ